METAGLAVEAEAEEAENPCLIYTFDAAAAAASAQLVKEGLSPDGIFNVGDIMYDALLAEMQKPSSVASFPSGDFALLSLHRQENVDHDDRLAAWVSAINTLALKQKIVMPLHPRTKARLEILGLSLKVALMPPQNHRNLLELIKCSAYVLTDSGGMQKEAFYLGKHCFTLRPETEWRELVALKVNHLVEPGSLLTRIDTCDFGFWPVSSGKHAGRRSYELLGTNANKMKKLGLGSDTELRSNPKLFTIHEDPNDPEWSTFACFHRLISTHFKPETKK